MTRSWLPSFSVSSKTRTVKGQQARRSRLNVESLEVRAMLTTLLVDINDATCDLDGDDLYCEIQEAIDDSSPGDDILVADGFYTPITIHQNEITIQAIDGHEPIIDGNLQPGNGVFLPANDVTIEGLTVANATAHGFLVVGDNNVLRDNTAKDGTSEGDPGFRLRNSSNNLLYGNTAKDNASRGFFLLRSGDNILENNTAKDNGDDGFRVAETGSDNNTLRGNTSKGNDQDGFLVLRCSGNTLEYNTAKDNYFNGFNIAQSSGITLVGNTAVRNAIGAGQGISISDTHNSTFRGNTAKDNKLGFLVINSDNNTLEDNMAKGNILDGFLLVSGTGNVIHGNTANGNGRFGFLVDEVFAEYNTFADNHCKGNVQGGSNLDGICDCCS